MAKDDPIRILGFAGSAREDSFNKKLVRMALRGAESSGVDVEFVDLKNYPLPLYDGDCELAQGLPEHLSELRSEFQRADGLLIASPEYNGFLSPMLKNTVDWLSRSNEASPDLSAYQGKVAAIMAASPGPLGGLRGLRGLRELLTNLGVTVLPNQITIRSAFNAFDQEGAITDDDQAKRIEAFGAELARVAGKLRS